MLNGESRGSTQADNAAIGNTYLTSQNVNLDACRIVYNNKADSGSNHKRESEKLAEHAIV